MALSASYAERMQQLGIAVLMPTYNNASTLAGVITDVLEYTRHVIVVNDGSTDNTEAVLATFPGIEKVSYSKNVGKGWALRQGFKKAIELGYKYVLTIDSDGQHFATDIPLFIDKLEAEGPALIMGVRNMNQDFVPGKSSFGNRISNYWFKVETGIDCPDTQTGYRVYPVHLYKKSKFFTRKYEFEIEVLVRSAWKGIKVNWVPIKVYYAPKETRISHFRPFKDFSRIGVLNTLFVFITFLYIRPRNFFRSIFRNRNWRQNLKEKLFDPAESDGLKAWSIGFGVFMGIVPLWGLQLIIAIALAFLFKLNKVLVVIAANISIPPMIPLIIFGSYQTGKWWMGDKAVNMPFSSKIDLETIKLNLVQYIYGSITLAIIAGIVFGLATYIILKSSPRKTTVKPV